MAPDGNSEPAPLPAEEVALTSHNAGEKCAWITAITGDKYVVGAQALARSLVASRSQHQLIVMAPPKLSESAAATLRQEPNIRVVRILPYELPAEVAATTNYAFARFADAWVKMRAWEVGHDLGLGKVCWLDADMLVLRNMDDIFAFLKTDRDVFAACPACVCNPKRVPTYPAWWNPENCRFTHLVRSMSPGGESSSSAPHRRYFNGGLLLFRPSRAELAEIEAGIIKGKDAFPGYSFAEQDFLNDYYSDTWIELPFHYNALKTLMVAHSPLWELPKVRNIHYILEKPWDEPLPQTCTADCLEQYPEPCPARSEDPYHGINRLWWRVFLGGNCQLAGEHEHPHAAASAHLEECAVGE